MTSGHRTQTSSQTNAGKIVRWQGIAQDKRARAVKTALAQLGCKAQKFESHVIDASNQLRVAHARAFMKAVNKVHGKIEENFVAQCAECFEPQLQLMFDVAVITGAKRILIAFDKPKDSSTELLRKHGRPDGFSEPVVTSDQKNSLARFAAKAVARARGNGGRNANDYLGDANAKVESIIAELLHRSTHGKDLIRAVTLLAVERLKQDPQFAPLVVDVVETLEADAATSDSNVTFFNGKAEKRQEGENVMAWQWDFDIVSQPRLRASGEFVQVFCNRQHKLEFRRVADCRMALIKSISTTLADDIRKLNVDLVHSGPVLSFHQEFLLFCSILPGNTDYSAKPDNVKEMTIYQVVRAMYTACVNSVRNHANVERFQVDISFRRLLVVCRTFSISYFNSAARTDDRLRFAEWLEDEENLKDAAKAALSRIVVAIPQPDLRKSSLDAVKRFFPENCFTPASLKDAETLNLSVSSVAKPSGDYVTEFFKFIPFPSLDVAEKRLDEANKAANEAPSYENLKWHRAQLRGRFGPAASTSPDDVEKKKRNRSRSNNVNLPGQVATEYMKDGAPVSKDKIADLTAQLTAFVRQLGSDEAVRTHVHAAAAVLRDGKKVDFPKLQFPLFQVSARSNQQQRIWIEGQASAPFAGPLDHGGLTGSLVKVAMSNINTADLVTDNVAFAGDDVMIELHNLKCTSCSSPLFGTSDGKDSWHPPNAGHDASCLCAAWQKKCLCADVQAALWDWALVRAAAGLVEFQPSIVVAVGRVAADVCAVACRAVFAGTKAPELIEMRHPGSLFRTGTVVTGKVSAVEVAVETATKRPKEKEEAADVESPAPAPTQQDEKHTGGGAAVEAERSGRGTRRSQSVAAKVRESDPQPDDGRVAAVEAGRSGRGTQRSRSVAAKVREDSIGSDPQPAVEAGRSGRGTQRSRSVAAKVREDSIGSDPQPAVEAGRSGRGTQRSRSVAAKVREDSIGSDPQADDGGGGGTCRDRDEPGGGTELSSQPKRASMAQEEGAKAAPAPGDAQKKADAEKAAAEKVRRQLEVQARNSFWSSFVAAIAHLRELVHGTHSPELSPDELLALYEEFGRYTSVKVEAAEQLKRAVEIARSGKGLSSKGTRGLTSAAAKVPKPKKETPAKDDFFTAKVAVRPLLPVARVAAGPVRALLGEETDAFVTLLFQRVGHLHRAQNALRYALMLVDSMRVVEAATGSSVSAVFDRERIKDLCTWLLRDDAKMAEVPAELCIPVSFHATMRALQTFVQAETAGLTWAEHFWTHSVVVIPCAEDFVTRTDVALRSQLLNMLRTLLLVASNGATASPQLVIYCLLSTCSVSEALRKLGDRKLKSDDVDDDLAAAAFALDEDEEVETEESRFKASADALADGAARAWTRLSENARTEVTEALIWMREQLGPTIQGMLASFDVPSTFHRWQIVLQYCALAVPTNRESITKRLLASDERTMNPNTMLPEKFASQVAAGASIAFLRARLQVLLQEKSDFVGFRISPIPTRTRPFPVFASYFQKLRAFRTFLVGPVRDKEQCPLDVSEAQFVALKEKLAKEPLDRVSFEDLFNVAALVKKLPSSAGRDVVTYETPSSVHYNGGGVFFSCLYTEHRKRTTTSLLKNRTVPVSDLFASAEQRSANRVEADNAAKSRRPQEAPLNLKKQRVPVAASVGSVTDKRFVDNHVAAMKNGAIPGPAEATSTPEPPRVRLKPQFAVRLAGPSLLPHAQTILSWLLDHPLVALDKGQRWAVSGVIAHLVSFTLNAETCEVALDFVFRRVRVSGKRFQRRRKAFQADVEVSSEEVAAATEATQFVQSILNDLAVDEFRKLQPAQQKAELIRMFSPGGALQARLRAGLTDVLSAERILESQLLLQRQRQMALDFVRLVDRLCGDKGDPIVILGAAGGNGGRGRAQVNQDVLHDALAGFFSVVILNEHNTSKLCPCCHRVAVAPRKGRSRGCRNSDCVAYSQERAVGASKISSSAASRSKPTNWWDRDEGASWNFISIFISLMLSGVRPAAFCPAPEKGEQ